MKKFINNKKGFTLVELIVSVAILGMISITVMGLMSTGTNMFTNVQRRAMVMFKSQSASVQVKGFLQNASGLICEDTNSNGSNILIFTDRNNLYEIYFDPDEKELDLCTFTKEEIKAMSNPDFTGDGIREEDHVAPLSYNVSDMKYTIYADEETGLVSSIKFDITTTRLGQEYTRSQVVSLRSVVNVYDMDTSEDVDAFETGLVNWANN